MTRESKLDVWEARCSNKELNSEELSKLIKEAKDTNDYLVISFVCASVASHKNVTLKMLEELFNTENPLILSAVLANPKTPSSWCNKRVALDDKKTTFKVNLDEIL